MLPDILIQIHRDLAEYLRQVSDLSELPIIDSRTLPDEGTGGNIQDLIDEVLSQAGMHTRDGRAGLAIVVLMPDVLPDSLELPGPMISLKLSVRIFENRIVNESESGFQISASRAAIHIVRALHHWAPKSTSVLIPFNPLIADISVPDTDGHEVAFLLRMPLPSAPRASQPIITADEEDEGYTITLTTNTEGAEIYYTLDGSFPGPTNGTLYTEPFLITEPGELRAIATHADRLPSSVSEATSY